MAEKQQNLSEEAEDGEEVIEQKIDSSEISDFPQTLVTEKIIFVIDILLLETEIDGEVGIEVVSDLCKSYFQLKKNICVKPPEFGCVLYNNSAVQYSHINSLRDLGDTFLSIKDFQCDEETSPLQIDKVFDKIAESVELPDPACVEKFLPPNWVYHVVWLFGRSLHVPTMENPNSFDFLMMTPYFALDMLYLYNDDLESNQCEPILEALQNLNENGKGYFLVSRLNSNKEQLIACIAQFLGHPLIRVPQSYARFNIFELGQEIEIHNSNKEK